LLTRTAQRDSYRHSLLKKSFRRLSTTKTPRQTPMEDNEVGSGIEDTLAVTLSIAKFGPPWALSTTKVKGLPENEMLPSGKVNPEGIAPVAVALPTLLLGLKAPLKASSSKGTPTVVLVANASDTLERGELKTIPNAVLVKSVNSTFPLSVLKAIGDPTMNPPGSNAVMNVADRPPTVSVNVVVLPLTSLSKLKTIGDALTQPALTNTPAIRSTATKGDLLGDRRPLLHISSGIVGLCQYGRNDFRFRRY